MTLVIVGMVRGLHKAPLQVSVIVPLYIYPSEGAWDPLYTAYVNESCTLIAEYKNFLLSNFWS